VQRGVLFAIIDVMPKSKIKTPAANDPMPLESMRSILTLNSNGNPTTAEQQQTELLSTVFGFSRKKTVMSETWNNFVPDPLTFVGTNGTKLYQIAGTTFNLLTDGTKTIYHLSWNATSLGWTTRWNNSPAPDIFVQVEDNKGGVVDSWNVGNQHLLCAGGPTVYTNNNAQNVYGVATMIVVTFSFGSVLFYKVC
jgi:hypothetical protein